MNASPNFYLSHEGYEAFVGSGQWQIEEVPLSIAGKFQHHFGLESSFCVFASGMALPSLEVSPQMIVGGIDWIKQEERPRPAEKPLNVYHYAIGSPAAEGYPVYHLGNNGSIAPHWAELEDLGLYFNQLNGFDSDPPSSTAPSGVSCDFQRQ